MPWTVADIGSRVRELTGRVVTSQLSDADLLDKINDYYRFIFPQEAYVKKYTQLITYNTVASTGLVNISTIDSSVVNLHGPVYLDGDQINFWIDHELFFQQYPLDDTTEGTPTDVLLYDLKVYIRPIPDDVFELTFNSTANVPTAFTALDTSTPDDEQWGAAIAYGTAIEILSGSGETREAASLGPLYDFQINKVRQKQLQIDPLGKRAIPEF